MAAQSIAGLPGRSDSVGDVLRARVFQPYVEALRQYLVLRIIDADQGPPLVLQVKEAVDGSTAGELFEPPGFRARLFRLARGLVEQRWAEDETGLAGDARSLPWRQPQPGVDAEYLAALHKLRLGLPPGDAELLELRHTRELNNGEIAYVLGSTAEDIEVQLELATAQARKLIGGRWADPASSIDTLLLEAFALEPGTWDLPRVSKGEWEGLTPGTIVGERYEIEGQTATGGMGNVYRANDTQVPNHVVALKLLHHTSLTEEARAAALRELHLIASVFHPSVVQFKDHGWHEGRLWFVMPWYEGETLQSRIERQPLTRAEAQPIFEQLALALASIHSAGIRHQDIKPENIFLTNLRGVGQNRRILPILLDLGVAAKEAELLLAGTPNYFAPEVAAQYARVSEPHPVSASADVFSLCLSLRNALEPTSAEDVAGGAVEHFIEHRALLAPRAPVTDDLRYLRGQFDRWLSIDPGQRPTAEGLAAELSVLTAPERRRQKWVRLARWLAPLLLALVAVFSSIAYGLNRRAEARRVEATQARIEANLARTKVDNLQEDLTEAAEREKALANDVAHAKMRYRSSVMTREELANKLARTEGQLRLAREDVTKQQQQREALDQQLAQTKTNLVQAQEEVAVVRSQLAEETELMLTKTRRLAELEGEATDLREQIRLAEGHASDSSARIAQLEQRVSGLQKSNRQLRREIEAQERQLKRLRKNRGKGGGAARGSEPSSPGPGEPSSPPPAEPPSPATPTE
jgi:hypothetical protein